MRKHQKITAKCKIKLLRPIKNKKGKQTIEKENRPKIILVKMNNKMLKLPHKNKN